MAPWRMAILAGIVAVSYAAPVEAGRWHWRHACGPIDCDILPPCGESLVPVMVKEKRKVCEVVCKPVQVETTVPVCRRVVETKTIERHVTVWKPITEMKEVTYQVAIPEWTEVERPQTICVPKQVECQGTRTVCQRVPVQTTRTVCRDAGHWECTVDRCGRPRKVWCSNIVTEEVPVTCWTTKLVEVPYKYYRTVYETKQVTRKYRVCNYRYETRSKQVPVTRCIPETITKKVQVPVYRTVVEQKKVVCTKWVQETVEREVEVWVCKMVPCSEAKPAKPAAPAKPAEEAKPAKPAPPKK